MIKYIKFKYLLLIILFLCYGYPCKASWISAFGKSGIPLAIRSGRLLDKSGRENNAKILKDEQVIKIGNDVKEGRKTLEDLTVKDMYLLYNSTLGLPLFMYWNGLIQGSLSGTTFAMLLFKGTANEEFDRKGRCVEMESAGIAEFIFDNYEKGRISGSGKFNYFYALEFQRRLSRMCGI